MTNSESAPQKKATTSNSQSATQNFRQKRNKLPSNLELVQPLESLGQQIKRRREAFRLSQRQLAQISGLTQTTIANIEAGKANPTYQTIARIANVFREEIRFKIDRPMKLQK